MIQALTTSPVSYNQTTWIICDTVFNYLDWPLSLDQNCLMLTHSVCKLWMTINNHTGGRRWHRLIHHRLFGDHPCAINRQSPTHIYAYIHINIYMHLWLLVYIWERRLLILCTDTVITKIWHAMILLGWHLLLTMKSIIYFMVFGS